MKTTTATPEKLPQGAAREVDTLYVSLRALDCLPETAATAAIVALKWKGVTAGTSDNYSAAMTTWSEAMRAHVEQDAPPPDLAPLVIAHTAAGLTTDLAAAIGRQRTAAAARVGTAMLDGEPQWSAALAPRWAAAAQTVIDCMDAIPAKATADDIAASEELAARWRTARAAGEELAHIEHARGAAEVLLKEHPPAQVSPLFADPTAWQPQTGAGSRYYRRIPRPTVDLLRTAAELLAQARPRYLSHAELLDAIGAYTEAQRKAEAERQAAKRPSLWG